MNGAVLIGLFLLTLVAGVPLAVGLGVASVAVLALAGFDQLAVPTNIYAGIAKYPLLAIPMFILAGMIFERSGVALRLVRFVTAIVGEWTGSLAVVAVLVSMLLGGISGSGPADAAAVAAVMLPSMVKRGYPKGFAAGLIAASGSTAIIIPPSVAFIVYSVMVPAATVPALFAAGLFPGIIAALCLLVPAVVISRRYGFGREYREPRPPLGQSLIDAIWGLLAPVIILGGLRTGIFTPTEAAVVAVAYGTFVGMVVYRSIGVRDLFRLLVDAGELSAVVMMIIGIASVFAWAGNTLGIFDAAAKALVDMHPGQWGMLLSVNLLLLVAGMFLDAISIFLILLPLLVPIAIAMGWDLVWFGVMMTINLAIGQFTPPMAIALMITSRIAGIGMEETFRWVIWLVLAMGAGLALMVVFPELALWLPGRLGYL
ncbi:TRAP transporter large permease [Thauera sp. 2A1]|uniref:TRAP transporter large permease n=1 Tax=Thauera sp. 2A1 TaxID=2570191 RepID=UPI0012925DE6|nr:TRAP transporter large permease [Thauera sp. 2A1]KAI5915161.1 TRAP transporter large permease [Thauera sp. 2A1]